MQIAPAPEIVRSSARRSAKAVLLMLIASNASAATFTVTSSFGSGAGTLHQAILDANANPGSDQIVFTVGGVNVTTSLPSITGPVAIDGLTSFGNVTIDAPFLFDGSRAFEFAAGSSGSSLTRVFVTTNFSIGVRILSGVTNVVVTASVLGDSIIISGDDNRVEGSRTGVVRIFGDRNQLLRNSLGFLRLLFADNNRIGSIGNGNRIESISMQSSAGTILEGNSIRASFPRSFPGVEISNALPPAAGGSTIRGNIISGFSSGITIYSGDTFTASPAAILITGNSIFDVGIPIDLGADGPTPNDPAPDADLGPNNLQNFPVLTSAVLGPSQLTVSGTLASVPVTMYRIELFGNPATDAEAHTFLGSFDVITDATGNATFTQSVTTLTAADEVVTATATNLTTSDTSEVSAPVVVDAPGQLGFDPNTISVSEQDGSVTLTVQRTGGTEGTVTVPFTTENGTATAPADFQAVSGTLIFGPGVTTQTIVVPIVNDNVPELDETFTLRLTSPTGGATLGTATATVTIVAQITAAEIPTMSAWSLVALAIALSAVALVRLR